MRSGRSERRARAESSWRAGLQQFGVGHVQPGSYRSRKPVASVQATPAISVGLNVHEWYASSDGGRTFTRGPIPIDADLTIDCDGDPDDCVPNDQLEYSDPWVAYGSDGTVYHSAIAHGDSAHGASVVVQTSSDQGQTSADASAGVAFEGTTTPFAFADKESMAVDPVHSDNVYLTWNPRQ